MPAMSSAFLSAAVALSLQLLLFAAAGPDPSPLTYCSTFINGISRQERLELKAIVQTVQALQSQTALARLTPTANASRVRDIEAWLAANQSKLEGRNSVVQCLAHRKSSADYHDRPTFSILLEYFKRPWGILQMASSLRAACASAPVTCELVVNVDNPHEAGAWAAVAAEAGGFVVPVFSANVHEARGYNRAARAARGRYLIIWQDDQLPPSGSPSASAWLTQLVTLLEAWPQLAIIGMNTYRLCKNHEPTNRFMPTPWEPDPRTGVRWSFVQLVDFAPLVIRATAFASLGGLEEGFTRRGDCGIWGDWELCSRAWLDGWQVGFLHLEGRGGDGHEGGTHTSANAEKCWGRQQHVAASGFTKRYGRDRFQMELCEKVRRLNVETFNLTRAADCPYGTEETTWGNCARPPPATTGGGGGV